MAALKRVPPGKVRGEHVYLIKVRSSLLVKIGRSVNVRQRFSKIQSMSPVELDLIWCTPGGANLESRLHRAFQIRRSHGEWFDFAGLDPIEAVEAFLSGESLPCTVRRADELQTFRLGQVVGIAAPDWSGPRLGRVSGVGVSGQLASKYWLEDVRNGDGGPAFLFHSDELRAVDPKDHRDARPWPSDADERSRFRGWKIVRPR